MKSNFAQKVIKDRQSLFFLRLMNEKDLDEISAWPFFTDQYLSWANFSFFQPQEKRFWFKANNTESLFWFSFLVDGHILSNPEHLKSWIEEGCKGELSFQNPHNSTHIEQFDDELRKSFNLDANASRKLLVGRISITTTPNEDEVIFGIAIHPDFVNLHLGRLATQMMLFALFELSDIDSVWLETQEVNVRAQRLYERLGFKRLGYHYKRNNDRILEKRYAYAFTRQEKEFIPDLFIVEE